MNLKEFVHLVKEGEEEVIAHRRHIHAHPELSFEEEETASYVESVLDELEIPHERIAGTGVVGRIETNRDGKTIMIRADMDALPVEEETGLPFASTKAGVMHACGHDVHTANLLGVARVLKALEPKLSGRFILLFQPAEEAGGGGREVVKEGLLQEVDMAIGLHVMPEPIGTIFLGDGAMSAYSDGFTIDVYGKAAHTSKPQEGIDALYVAAKLIDALYGLMAKGLDPKEVATLSLGVIEGGTAPNIVPDHVTIKGMTRALSLEARSALHDEISALVTSLSKAYGARGEFTYKPGYPAVYNDSTLFSQAEKFLEKHLSPLMKECRTGINKLADPQLVTHPEPRLGAEDFGFYAQEVPSLFLWLGTGESYPQHNGRFTVDESAIVLATCVLSLLALHLTDHKEVIA